MYNDQNLVRNVAEEPWMEYAGMVESGDPASSLKLDEVVYGRATSDQRRRRYDQRRPGLRSLCSDASP